MLQLSGVEFLFSFGSNKIININVHLMHRKMNPAQVYAPSNAKNIIYYPIQLKKGQPQPIIYQNVNPHHNLSIRSEKYKESQLSTLKRLNQELRQREEVYIHKLMKLQQGLQNQHTEFVKLQELYSQLFQSYKQKQAQIATLENKYRETERYRQIQRNQEFRQMKDRQQEVENCRLKDRFKKESTVLKEQEISSKQNQWLNKEKEWKIRQNQLITINETLTQKLMKMNEKYQKSIQEASSARNKDKLIQSRTLNNQKLTQQIQHWQSQFTLEKQSRLKFQYQNEFLKNRSKDLEKQREQLEQLVTYKQNQIAKLRQQKINIHRQTSQKMMSRSPTIGSRDVLKTLIPVNNLTVAEERYKQSEYSENDSSLKQQDQKKGQFFSFCMQKQQQPLYEQLPSFPAQLQIQNLIKVHKNE